MSDPANPVLRGPKRVGLCGAVDFAVHVVDRIVSACVGIPVEEWYVLGRHFYEAGSILDQASGQETSSTEPTGVVTLANFLGLLLDVEGFAPPSS